MLHIASVIAFSPATHDHGINGSLLSIDSEHKDDDILIVRAAYERAFSVIAIAYVIVFFVKLATVRIHHHHTVVTIVQEVVQGY